MTEPELKALVSGGIGAESDSEACALSGDTAREIGNTMQMGLAQREVDVLRERTHDGMKAKLLAGGWAHKAPEGYLNKERLVKSNKYERWVEIDPVQSQAHRKAWELLLTDRYTLVQICEELHQLGYTHATGRPWAWTDPQTGKRRTADTRLHKIFHNPFYAGWVTSERFGIRKGQVKGNWEPTVSPGDFERGLAILRQHDQNKARHKKHCYLVRDALWVEVDGRRYKMYGSTATGRTQTYAYYYTQARPRGKKHYIQCEAVDGQLPAWLAGVSVAKDALLDIRALYEQQVAAVTRPNREARVADIRNRISRLRDEEAHLGRLLVTGKLSDEVYDQLRLEWQEKLDLAEADLASLEREAVEHLDDLDAALALLGVAEELYPRLDIDKQITLLKILLKKLVVDEGGTIVAFELRSPFAYLHLLKSGWEPSDSIRTGSGHMPTGALYIGRPAIP